MEKNSICDTKVFRSLRYQLLKTLGLSGAISLKLAKWAKKSNCDTTVPNSRRAELLTILGLTGAITEKRSKPLRTRFVIVGQ